MIETAKRVMIKLCGCSSDYVDRVRFILLGGKRNVIFLAFEKEDEAPFLVVKIARRSQYNRFLENEHAVLTKIAELNGGRKGGFAPLPRGLTHDRGVAVSVQTAVSGAKIIPRFHRVRYLNNKRRIEDHFRLGLLPSSSICGLAANRFRTLGDSTKKGLIDDPIDFLLRSVKTDKDTIRLLERYAYRLESFYGKKIPTVLSHNDFNPHNLFVDNGRIQIIDWEFSRFDSFPLFDFYHFPFMYSFKYLPGDSRSKHEAFFYDKGWLSDIVKGYMGKISETYGVDSDLLRALFPLYLIYIINRDLKNQFSTDWHPFIMDTLRYHFENDGRFLS
jgi:hypothetical protein